MADLPMLRRWLAEPEIARWWGDPEEQAGEIAAGLAGPAIPAFAAWIVEHDGRPFAYAQDYDPHAWPRHHFGGLPPGSRGIDQFIGEPAMLGRGHGPAFIRAHVERLFEAGGPAVGTDPHPDNARARRAYEKAGFRGAELREMAWGLAVLMVCRL